MFDLMTILTLIAPAVVAPLAGMLVLRAIERAEAARHGTQAPAPAIVLDPNPAAAVTAEPARHVA